MKTTFRTILCAAAVMLAAASCQKSVEPANPVEEGKGTIDIRVNGLMGEYTQVDATKSELVNTVRVSWKAGDVVYVYDGAQCLGSLIASLDGTEDRYALLSTDDTHTVSAPASGAKLTLVHSPLLTEAPDVSEGAISISLASQSGTKAPFVAYATLDYTGTTITNAIVPFKFATSVIKINCTGLKANTAITSATLSNVNTACKLTLSGTAAPTVSGSTNGTIIRTGDEYFAAGKINAEGEAVFQIAVPALEEASQARVLTVEQGSYKFKDKKFTTNSLAAATSVNTVCQLVGLPVGALKGEFTVSDDGGATTKQIYFSQGNLTYNVSTTTWAFYEHQYDCATGYDANLISLFTWGYDATKSIVPNGIASDNVSRTSGNLSQTEDWGCTIGDGNTWRTLTREEWCYLFAYNPENDEFIEGHPRRQLFKYGVTVCGKANCVVLLPDGWVWNEATVGTSLQSEYNETSTTVKWSTMEVAGAVCLPAAGHRNGSSAINVGGAGNYWSSTASGENDAYFVNFNIYDVFPGSIGGRGFRDSVRLITESK